MTDDREYLKPFIHDFAERNLEKSRKGEYICPWCGSGTGRNKSGALSIDEKTDRFKCFACGVGGDLFDLIGKINGVEAAESFQIARELYGSSMQTAATMQRKQPQEKAAADFTEYIEKCRKAFKQSPEALAYLQGRGISETTAARSLIGFDSLTRSIVFPYSKNGRYYTRRAIDRKEYRKPSTNEAGTQPLYNRADLCNAAALPVFIVEGEFDALSIMEIGSHAVALAGAQNWRKLIDAIQQKKPTGTLIVSLDNDEAGEKAAAELIEALKPLQIPFLKADITSGRKDANEALTADRAAFVAAVRAAEQQAAALVHEQEEQEREEYNRRNCAAAFISQFTEDIADSAANTPYTPTGFENLDRLLDGGLYAGLYILGAVSSLGKTTLCLQITDQIAESGQDVLFFSLEMGKAEIMSKSISRESFLHAMQTTGESRLAKTARGITTGSRWQHYTPAEVETIKTAIAKYAEYAERVYIVEGMGDIGVKEIRQQVTEHIRITGKTPVVFVDYLQILAPADPRTSDKQNTDKAVLELKRMSRDLKTPVIAVSSLNRDNYNAPINMSAYKESGAIEYGSDVLIGLQAKGAGESGFNIDEAKKKDPREIELKILKNRNGRTGETIDFEYYPLFNYYRISDKTTETTAAAQGRSRSRR